MVSQFVYAFDENGKKELMRLGYKMVHEDNARGIYVFLNYDVLDFSVHAGKFALSDTLTF